MKRIYPYQYENNQEPEKKILKLECDQNIFRCMNQNVILKKQLFTIKEDEEYECDIDISKMEVDCYNNKKIIKYII